MCVYVLILFPSASYNGALNQWVYPTKFALLFTKNPVTYNSCMEIYSLCASGESFTESETYNAEVLYRDCRTHSSRTSNSIFNVLDLKSFRDEKNSSEPLKALLDGLDVLCMVHYRKCPTRSPNPFSHTMLWILPQCVVRRGLGHWIITRVWEV